jgi:hypothetical protein
MFLARKKIDIIDNVENSMEGNRKENSLKPKKRAHMFIII